MLIAINLTVGMPAPVDTTLRNRGASPVTSFHITLGQQTVSIDRGLALLPGERLAVQMSHPAGVRIEDAAGHIRNALGCVSRMVPLEAEGPVQIALAVVYGGPGGQAETEITCRGIWR